MVISSKPLVQHNPISTHFNLKTVKFLSNFILGLTTTYWVGHDDFKLKFIKCFGQEANSAISSYNHFSFSVINSRSTS